MRIWSIHPEYLDRMGLVALWRETLLAQKVLAGNTRGYRNHPQLLRFKSTDDPVGTVASYLHFVADEADRRGYSFDRTRIIRGRSELRLPAASGQILYEFRHLLGKLERRDPEKFVTLKGISDIKLHPLFYETEGDVAPWEKV